MGKNEDDGKSPFLQFCAQTTLHGWHYLGDFFEPKFASLKHSFFAANPGLPRCRRILWTITIAFSLLVASYFIHWSTNHAIEVGIHFLLSQVRDQFLRHERVHDDRHGHGALVGRALSGRHHLQQQSGNVFCSLKAKFSLFFPSRKKMMIEGRNFFSLHHLMIEDFSSLPQEI